MNLNKKAMELSFQTIVILILAIIVLIIMISFITTYIGGGSEQLAQTGSDILNSAKSGKIE